MLTFSPTYVESAPSYILSGQETRYIFVAMDQFGDPIESR